MGIVYRIPAPHLHLYRLTLQIRGKPANAYSMGESVEDAFSRYVVRATNQKQNAADIEFIQGDLANPNPQQYQ